MDKTAKIFKDVRFIKDREKANAQNTNRPHEDILDNLEFFSSTFDGFLGQSARPWLETEGYKKGDVVSYGSYFYESLKDNNTGNAPTPRVEGRDTLDTFWHQLSRTSSQKFMSDITEAYYPNQGGFGARTPTLKTNGRFHTLFKGLERKKVYSLFRVHGRTPFNGEYHLRIHFTNGIPATTGNQYVSGESYVIFEVDHRGYTRGISGQSVPSVFIKECYCHAQDGDLAFVDNDNFNLFSDRFGPYGLNIVSVLYGDGSVGINLVFRETADVTISGSYDIEPNIMLNTSNAEVAFVNHLVRPFGGDLAQNIGSLVAFDNTITKRQAWDYGLLWRGFTSDIILSSSVYSKLFLAKGYKHNIHGSSNFTKYARPVDIKAIDNTTAETTMMLKSISNRVLRNAGTLTSEVGSIQEDATRKIYGGWDGETLNDGRTLAFGWRNNAPHTQVYHGAFKRGRVAVPHDLYNSSTPLESYGWQMDSSLIVPTASENRVKSLIVQYYTQAF